MIENVAAPSEAEFQFDSIDSFADFVSSYGIRVMRAPKRDFYFFTKRWEFPNLAVHQFESTPFIAASGPPQDPLVGGPAVSILSCEWGGSNTDPRNGEAYCVRAGDLEIAGDDTAQTFELIDTGDGTTRMFAICLSSDDLKALGALVPGGTMGLLRPSPLRSVIDTYLRAFGSPETLSADAGLLVRNFTEVLSFVIRGSLTAGVKDAPGVLFHHHERALHFTTASCRRFGC
ncbi:hypothetical protein [Inquilinus limosus]|uniref:hypothetical protein n=1 Tax=Inquilinus limosus TaxID=171674 RepID=UPI003F175947